MGLLNSENRPKSTDRHCWEPAKEAGRQDASAHTPRPICVICSESAYTADRLVQFPCGCFHCDICINYQLDFALSKPNPPKIRCCTKKPLTLAVMKLLLYPWNLHAYDTKLLEGDTKDKTYCTGPSCSRFTNPQSMHNNEAICQKCNHRTCAKCKLSWHWGSCSPEADVQNVFASMEGESWAKRPRCGEAIEWMGGCPLIE